MCNPSVNAALGSGMEPEGVDNFGKVRRPLRPEEVREQRDILLRTTEVYAEFPPLWRGGNRFGVPDELWEALSPPPVFDDHPEVVSAQEADAESRRYTHMAYVACSGQMK